MCQEAAEDIRGEVKGEENDAQSGSRPNDCINDYLVYIAYTWIHSQNTSNMAIVLLY